MEPLTGALLAAAVACASILAAIRLPLERWLPAARLRVVGAITLGLLSASALGAKVPAHVPLLVLALGALAVAWSARVRPLAPPDERFNDRSTPATDSTRRP